MNIHYFDIVSVGHVSVVQPLNYPVSPLPVGLHDLSLLHRELHQVSHKWFSLGVQLQIPFATLISIELDNNHQTSKCLLEMLTVWLQRINPSPTWSVLIEALESPFVDERLLAQQLRDKCPRNEGWVPPSYPTQGPSPSTAASAPQGSAQAMFICHFWQL